MEKEDQEGRSVALRIVDANANRCAEGLRVVEEIARFVIEDGALQGELKELRHAVRRAVEGIGLDAVRARDSDKDVGRDSFPSSEGFRGSVAGVARANFFRSEEGLRVMEEFGKLVDPGLSRRCKSLRFSLYTLERRFFRGEGGGLAMPRSPFLYAILDRSRVAADDVEGAVKALLGGGVDMVQYRAKEVAGSQRRRDLAAILPHCGERGVPLIVNDDPELAAEVGASGVHLGARDPEPGEARRVVGPNRLVGLSVHLIGELEAAGHESVDYIAVGSIYPSSTKPDVRPVGTSLIAEAKARTDLPVVAIGGITAERAAEVLDAGADGIALVDALFTGDIMKNCFTFREIIDTRVKRNRITE